MPPRTRPALLVRSFAIALVVNSLLVSSRSAAATLAAPGRAAFVAVAGGGRDLPPRRLSSSRSTTTAATTTTTAGGSKTRLASSLGFATPAPRDNDADKNGVGAVDPLKWDRMYRDGESAFGDSEDVDPTAFSRSELRVVTFDLDNTLWKTGATIGAANDALSAFLKAKGVVTPVRTEVIMGELFQNDVGRYCPYLREEAEVEEAVGGSNGDDDDAADDDDDDDGVGVGVVDNVGQSNVYIQAGSHKPVLLTQLRKDAVADLLVRHNDYAPPDAMSLSEEAFDVWTAARHGAIPDHLAESVLEVLETIAALRTSATGGPPVVGAITDGNSDPRTVPLLGQYFDFVINSENVGVAKPDKRVYHAAVREVASHPGVADLFVEAGGTPVVDAGGNVNEDALGPWWVHIGDDFIKDCVAAKELKMRSVWCRELVLPSSSEEGDSSKSSPPKGKKTRDAADLVKELAEMKPKGGGVIEMSIGAEDFVADSIHREFTDAVLDRFGEVGETLARWHEEGLAAAAAGAVSTEGVDVPVSTSTSKSNSSKKRSSGISAEDMEAIADVLEVIVPDEPPIADAAAATTDDAGSLPTTRSREPEAGSDEAAATARGAPTPTPKQRETKFCMYCGEANLPIEAKFCSACGEEQPRI